MVLGGDARARPAARGELRPRRAARRARARGRRLLRRASPRTRPATRARQTRADDRRRLAEKLERADFAVTQFFFEAAEWRGLVDELAALGVTKPVLPGIMPVTSLASVPRMAEMGAPVPRDLVERLEAAGAGAGGARAAGVAAAVDLWRRCSRRGAPGLHFYTLNRSSATREIHEALFA